MTKLSVNINKFATLRNSRGGNVPDVCKAAVDVQTFGADGVTVHPRPDERHIRYRDVYDMRPLIHTEFNIEGYPSPEFMELVMRTHPNQVTLVPDPPGALTSNAGWDTRTHLEFLQNIVGQLKEKGIRTSIFTGTDPIVIEYAAKTDTDRIELYTEPYASLFPGNPEKAIEPFVQAAELANKLGLKINAGHDLTLQNLNFFCERIPYLKEVSIGHALVADALYLGLEQAIVQYKALLPKK